eukprot:UN32359
MEELDTYILYKKTEAEDLRQLENFNNNMLTAEELEGADMDAITKLQTKIQELEFQLLTEKSNKFWGLMRVRVRDRKLREREEEVQKLQEKIGNRAEDSKAIQGLGASLGSITENLMKENTELKDKIKQLEGELADKRRKIDEYQKKEIEFHKSASQGSSLQMANGSAAPITDIKIILQQEMQKQLESLNELIKRIVNGQILEK